MRVSNMRDKGAYAGLQLNLSGKGQALAWHLLALAGLHVVRRSAGLPLTALGQQKASEATSVPLQAQRWCTPMMCTGS